MKKSIALVATLFVLSACAGGSTAPFFSAMDLANQLASEVPEAGTVTQMTETNDANSYFGRPGKYSDGAYVSVVGLTCSELGVDCGATIEVWPSHSDAVARAQYVQDALAAMPMLGTEYDYVSGNYLLRISGDVTPTVADEFNGVFKGDLVGPSAS